MVEANQHVTIAYTLKDQNGQVVDQAPHNSPLTYLHGHGTIIPGLERALEGHKVGDHLTLWLSPADAYGDWDEKLLLKVDRTELAHIPNLEVGLEIEMVSFDPDENDEEGPYWEPWMPEPDLSDLGELSEFDDDGPDSFAEGEGEGLDGKDQEFEDELENDIDSAMDDEDDEDDEDEDDEDGEEEITLFVIREINGDEITLDGNHPLAGQNVFVEVSVLAVEPAPFEAIEESLLRQLRKRDEDDDDSETHR